MKSLTLSDVQIGNHIAFMNKFHSLAKGNNTVFKSPSRKKPPNKPRPASNPPLESNVTVLISERSILINESLNVDEIFVITTASKDYLSHELNELKKKNLSISDTHIANSMINDIVYSLDFYEARLEKYGFYNSYLNSNLGPSPPLVRNKRT